MRARARESARERRETRARLEITRNQNALKTHSKRTRTRTRARTRDARMTLESIRSPPRARSRFQRARETRNRSKCESNAMRFDSFRFEIVPRSSQSRSFSSSRDARSVVHDVVRDVTAFERSRARTRTRRALTRPRISMRGNGGTHHES